MIFAYIFMLQTRAGRAAAKGGILEVFVLIDAKLRLRRNRSRKLVSFIILYLFLLKLL